MKLEPWQVVANTLQTWRKPGTEEYPLLSWDHELLRDIGRASESMLRDYGYLSASSGSAAPVAWTDPDSGSTRTAEEWWKLLRQRDKFIVDSGNWEAFVAWLPASPLPEEPNP